MKTGLVILAAGNSSRMGEPKLFLDFEGKTFLEHIIRAYRAAGIEDICIVLNENLVHDFSKKIKHKDIGNIQISINKQVHLGRFHSLQLGAKKLMHTDACFIQNIDNPFTEPELIKNMISISQNKGYLVPVYKGKGGHPVLISKEVMRDITEREASDISLKDFLHEYERKELIVDQKGILENINTPEDYQNKILKKHLAYSEN